MPCQTDQPILLRLESVCKYQNPELLVTAARNVIKEASTKPNKYFELESERLHVRKFIVRAIQAIDTQAIQQRSNYAGGPEGPPSSRSCRCTSYANHMQWLQHACWYKHPKVVVDAIKLFMERSPGTSVESWKKYFAKAIGMVYVDHCPRLTEIRREKEARRRTQGEPPAYDEVTATFLRRVIVKVFGRPAQYSDAVAPPTYKEVFGSRSREDELLPAYSER